MDAPLPSVLPDVLGIGAIARLLGVPGPYTPNLENKPPIPKYPSAKPGLNGRFQAPDVHSCVRIHPPTEDHTPVFEFFLANGLSPYITSASQRGADR